MRSKSQIEGRIDKAVEASNNNHRSKMMIESVKGSVKDFGLEKFKM